MKGTEGEISIKAFLNNSARPYMGIVRDKVMGFDWLIGLDWIGFSFVNSKSIVSAHF